MTEVLPTDHGSGPGDGLGADAGEIAAWVASLPGLPPDDGDRYGIRRLTAAWALEARRGSVHTAVGYGRDLSTYLRWCQQERLDPLTARPTDVGQYRVWRELGYAGRPAKPATVARALAAVSSWYTYLVVNTDGAVVRNPVAGTKRPKAPRKSPTAGLTLDEVDLLLAQADAEVAARAEAATTQPTPYYRTRHLAALRDRALLRMLADLGIRINEALARNISDLSHNAAHRTLRIVVKGGDVQERALPRHTLDALRDYLSARAAATGIDPGKLTGPIFATTGMSGEGRLAEANVFTLIRRLANAAGIPSAARLSAHSLRHAFATDSRAVGVPLEDVQDAMHHADPRTTRRYDRDRHSLDRDPAYVLAALRASQRPGQHRIRPQGGEPAYVLAALRASQRSGPTPADEAGGQRRTGPSPASYRDGHE
ncbi:tyrosine-type recombinase/integrase [Polymorphospora sp. NPDC050346]|uniref:tyrosine-type recombinase/integrase n=1 Tax=Polymorphospora sp. NPDC050346 TaxID=3155780 RepID=UPI0033DF8286